MEKRKSRPFYAVYSAVLTAAALVLAVRALYGFCWSDESFYLTFAQRLWNGQKLILDEWHPVQFYSVLFYPILSLYHAFFGNTGIYLFAREIYIAAAWGTSLLLFHTLSRKASPLTAFLCAAAYLVYSRGNIWGLSYYNLFLTLCLLFACLVVRERKWQWVLGGLCLAGAVLCVPYFALFVILGLIAALCIPKTRQRAGWTTLGVCILAIVFLVCFLPKDLTAVLTNLKEILSDPEHSGGPIVYLLAAVRDAKMLYCYDILLTIFAGLVLLLGVRLLPKKLGAVPGLLIAACGAALSLWRYRAGELGFAFYQFAIFCLPAMALCWVKREISCPALLLRLLGMLMAISMGLSSNTEAITFTVGLPVYAMGALMQLDSLPQKGEGLHLRQFGTVLACAVICLSFATRLTNVFRDGPLSTLTQTMTEGPAAGIRTTQTHAREYGDILTMLEDLEDTYAPENSIFFTSILPWGYLAADFPCAAPTAWRTKLSGPQLESYYKTHEKPAIVVVLGEHVGESPDKPSLNENDFSGWFWNDLQENYSSVEYPCATVYLSESVILKGA